MGRFEGSRSRDSGRGGSRGGSRRDSSYSRDSSRSSYGRSSYGGRDSGRSSYGGRDSGRSSYGGRDSGRSSYGGRSSGRSSYGGRDSGRDRRGGNDIEMTKVICASCKQECEIPFKPKTDKPVYCRDCYAKEGNGGRSSGRSFGGGSKVTEKDIDQINEKLNKILKALKVE